MNNQQTKSELLKSRVLEIARQLLASANKNNPTFIAEATKVIDEFEKHRPAVYIFLEGGNIQGASATCDIDFNLFDKDNYKAGDDSQTPEEWNDQIEAMTESNEIKGIY